MSDLVTFRQASCSRERVVVRRLTAIPTSAKQSIAGRLSQSSKSSFSEARYTPAHGHSRTFAPPFGLRPPDYRRLRDVQNVDSLSGSGAKWLGVRGGHSSPCQTASSGTFWGSSSVTTRTRNEWGERNLGGPASNRLRWRPCCTARAAVRFGRQPVCWWLIVVRWKGGLVPIRECEWDTRGGFTKSDPDDSQGRFPGSLCRSCSYGHIRGSAVPARGNRRWTGATPPFCCPVRARECCAIHICATPPGGVAPVSIIPGGKATERVGLTGLDRSAGLDLRRRGNLPRRPSVGASARTGLWAGPKPRSGSGPGFQGARS